MKPSPERAAAPLFRDERLRLWVTRGIAIVGIALLALNAAGFFWPLRATDVDGYVDFAGRPTLTIDQTMRRLQTIVRERERSSDADFVREATLAFHEGMAHISPKDVRRRGLAHYGMRVPPTENWILYLLSHLKPDTYRDYEFCDYRRALRRGTGRCGQQSLALVSFLAENNVRTGFVALGGHALVTAEVAPGEWHLLDPDYGGVVPFSLAEAERRPGSVLPHYWNPAARENGLDMRYEASGNRLRLGGPEVRYPRACRIEYGAYFMKWLVPVACLVPLILVSRRKAFRR